MNSVEGEGSRRISVDLPTQLIDRFDQLKKEWGLRGRGAVLRRLLEELLADNDLVKPIDALPSNNSNDQLDLRIKDNSQKHQYNENTALVLISNNKIKTISSINESKVNSEKVPVISNPQSSTKIDLPAFVRKKTQVLRESLGKSTSSNSADDPQIFTINEYDINESLHAAIKHWSFLYDQKPNEIVVEAAMKWLACDIWINLDTTEDRPFTWSYANKCICKYYPKWENLAPKFERIIVIAGVLEDPFGTNNLPDRMPSLIRRFVNSFKRSSNVTSFETLESTMTVHGALKLLGLPTRAGSSLTLSKIRDCYKAKAMENHPDAGGNPDTMRKLNEGYQLLKEHYRQQ